MSKQIKVNKESNPVKFEVSRGAIVARVIFPSETGTKAGKIQVLNPHTDDSQVSSIMIDTAHKSVVSFPKIIDDDKNLFRLIDATREGLPYKSLRNAEILMPFSSNEWAKMLHVSKRSIDRLKKEKRKLNSTQSEKLIEVTLLYDYGVDVFGSEEKFGKWLERDNVALGGIQPKSLLDTNQGIKAVKSELSRIEYGILA